MKLGHHQCDHISVSKHARFASRLVRCSVSVRFYGRASSLRPSLTGCCLSAPQYESHVQTGFGYTPFFWETSEPRRDTTEGECREYRTDEAGRVVYYIPPQAEHIDSIDISVRLSRLCWYAFRGFVGIRLTRVCWHTPYTSVLACTPCTSVLVALQGCVGTPYKAVLVRLTRLDGAPNKAVSIRLTRLCWYALHGCVGTPHKAVLVHLTWLC